MRDLIVVTARRAWWWARAAALAAALPWLPGCPLPPPDGCTPHSYVCREDPNAAGAPRRPAVCSPTQRWAWVAAPCPEGTVCRADLPSVLGAATVAGCAPPADGGL